MKVNQTTVNFIIAEIAKRKLSPGEFFTQIISGEDVVLTLESFFEWAKQNNKIEDGKVDLSDFMK